MVQTPTKTKIIYPESDGKPMADNTKQFYWIVKIKENLESLYAADPNVFIAGDLLWYPVKGDKSISQAPDTMVVFGRPKGDRSSYIQHEEEEGIAPQVIFEIRSPSNTQTALDEKLVFYSDYGVEEYYLYDPDKNDLSGWLRENTRLMPIHQLDGWKSPRLKIKFELTSETLEIYRLDGIKFATHTEQAKEIRRLKEKLQKLEGGKG